MKLDGSSSINQSINQSANQSANQSTNQSINQSIIQWITLRNLWFDGWPVFAKPYSKCCFLLVLICFAGHTPCLTISSLYAAKSTSFGRYYLHIFCVCNSYWAPYILLVPPEGWSILQSWVPVSIYGIGISWKYPGISWDFTGFHGISWKYHEIHEISLSSCLDPAGCSPLALSSVPRRTSSATKATMPAEHESLASKNIGTV